jgi:hypothetical protein
LTLPGLTRSRLRATAKAIETNPYIPVVPFLKQLEFIALPQKEKGYGGAAGGGKSEALLIDALLPVTIDGYAGLILRKTFPDLSQPGAIMTRAKEWLIGKPGVKWYERDKVFVFSRYNSRLQFGFLKNEDDKFRYQSAEFQKINWDEATQFPWSQYSYLRSRLRRSTSVPVPPTLGCATNPGGVGHNWFYRWFVKGDGVNRIFLPAALKDNPYLHTEEYQQMLSDLDEITRRQLLNGEWVLDETGRPFKREFFDSPSTRYRPSGASLGSLEDRPIGRKMFVDCAISDKINEPGVAYNAVVIMELLASYKMRVRYVWREKCGFPTLVKMIRQLGVDYNYDGLLDGIVIEDKANGPAVYQTIREGNDPHLGRIVTNFMPAGSKGEKYHQAALWCERSCVELPYPIEDNVRWLFAFEEELYEAPDGEYLDQADAFTLGVIYMEHYLSRGHWFRQSSTGARYKAGSLA